MDSRGCSQYHEAVAGRSARDRTHPLPRGGTDPISRRDGYWRSHATHAGYSQSTWPILEVSSHATHEDAVSTTTR